MLLTLVLWTLVLGLLLGVTPKAQAAKLGRYETLAQESGEKNTSQSKQVEQGGTDPLVFAVYALRDPLSMQKDYSALEQYLNQTLQQPVKVQVLSEVHLREQLVQNKIDFALLPPIQYVQLRTDYPLSAPLATVLSTQNGTPSAWLGGVIVVRKDANMESVEQLINSNVSIGISDVKSIGGFAAQAVYLHEKYGLSYEKLSERIKMVGQPHENVLDALDQGHMSAGFVRTGMLEYWHKKDPKRWNMNQFKVLDEKRMEQVGLRVSTDRVYPDWVVVGRAQLDKRVMGKTIAALMALNADDPALTPLYYDGFTVPGDYTAVRDLMYQLRIAPFDKGREFNWVDVWQTKRGWMIAAVVVTILGAGIALALLVYGVSQKRHKKKLMHLNALLEEDKMQLRLAAKVFEQSYDGICIVDAHGVIQRVNPAFEALCGYPANELVGAPVWKLLAGRQDQQLLEHFWENMRNIGVQEEEVWMQKKDAHVLPIHIKASVLEQRAQHLQQVHSGESWVQYVVIFSDISEFKERQEHLEALAYVDELTKLANRRSLYDALHWKFEQHKKDADKYLMLVLIDLDGFKKVNDTYGHDQGDALLKSIARCMHKWQTEQEEKDRDVLCARLGGDEFVVLIEVPYEQVFPCRQAIEQLCQRMQEHISIQEKDNGTAVYVQVGVSAGVALSGSKMGYHYKDPSRMLKAADQALYQAKANGRGHIHWIE